MFNNGTLSDGLSTQNEDWFPPPFGFPTTCPAIEAWKKSPHFVRLRADCAEATMINFLKDYERVVKEWLAKKIRTRLGEKATSWDVSEVYGPNFSLEDFSPDQDDLKEAEAEMAAFEADPEAKLTVEEIKTKKSRVKTLKVKYALTAALLYFSDNILDEVLKEKLNNLREVQKGLSMSWGEATNVLLWGSEENSIIKEIAKLATMKRCEKRHPTPLEWIYSLQSQKVRLEALGVVIPEKAYLEYITDQLSWTEQRCFTQTEMASTDALLKGKKRNELPKFKTRSIASQVKWMPVWPNNVGSRDGSRQPHSVSQPNGRKRDKAKPRKEDSRPDSKSDQTKRPCRFWAAGNCRRGQDCKFAHEPKPKGDRRSDRLTKKEPICYKCNQRGHIATDPKCPKFRKKRDEKRQTFTSEKNGVLATANEPPLESSGRTEVLVDFLDKKRRHEVHCTDCPEYLMAQKGWCGPGAWDIRNVKPYQSKKIRERKDCVAAPCCEEELQEDGLVFMTSNHETRGIMLATIDVISPKSGLPYPTVAGLDTCSNTTISDRELIHQVVTTKPVKVAVCGNTTELEGTGKLLIIHPRGVQEIPTCVGDAKQRPIGAGILLSKNDLRRLGVDLRWHLNYMGNEIPPVKYLEKQLKTYPEEKQKDLPPGRVYSEASDECLPEIYISENKMREYMNRMDWIIKGPKPTPLRRIDVNPNLPLELGLTQEESECKIRELCASYADVLSQDSGLPPIMKGGKHRLNLKENWRHVSLPEPRWTPAKREYWLQWAKLQIESGAYELSRGRSASYGVPVVKSGPEGKNDPNWEVRPCGGYVRVNEQGHKVCQPIQRPEKTVERFVHARIFFKADGLGTYNQIELEPGVSREILGIWTPMGVLQPTRMPFGWINAAAVLGQRVQPMLASIEDLRIRSQLANHADDFLGGAATLFTGPYSLYNTLEKFFEVCRQYHFTLKTTKMKIGYATEVFIGRELGQGKTSVSLDNLKPIRQMQEPTDKSSLRSVLGLCVMSKPYIGTGKYEGSYSQITKPLTQLTGKMPWRWGNQEQKAFQRLKAAVLARPNLFAPDYTKRFRVRLDASDFGVGALLYQTDKEYSLTEASIIPWKEMRIVKYSSQTFTTAMVMSPAYYKEAYVIRWALGKEYYWYLIFSPFQTYVETDHAPLQFMKNSLKGPISAWHATELSQISFATTHLPGELNIQADGLSRFPFIRIHSFHFHGTSKMWQTLLKSLSLKFESVRKLWVFAGSSTAAMARMVQAWRNPKNSIVKTAPRNFPTEYDLALLAPVARRAPEVCAKLFDRQQPFACLVPLDLVNWISLRKGRIEDPALQNKVENATKIVFLNSNCCWILSKCAEGPHEIYGAESPHNKEEDEDPEEKSNRIRSKWIQLQQNDRKKIQKEYGDSILLRDDGLMLVALPGDPARIIVPRSERKPLVMRSHQDLNHRSQRYVYLHLRKSYIWKGMSGDIFRWVRACECQLTRMKMKLMHGLYHAILYSHPGEAIAVDFQHIGSSNNGMTVVMSVVDMCSGHNNFVPLLKREGPLIVEAILHEHVYDRGTPLVIHSDADPALMSLVVQGLLQALRIDHIETRHYPQGNAHVERSFYMLNECLRRMPVQERGTWPKEMKPLGFYSNSVPSENLDGLSVYEFERGWAPRLPFDSQFVEKPSDEGKVPGMFGRLKRNQTVYRKIALDRRRAILTDSNKALNEKGFKPVIFKKGDLVGIYLPPPREKKKLQDSSDSDKKAWKQKHKNRFIGPCKVIEKLSRSWYRVETLNAKVYKRHVSSIVPYRVDEDFKNSTVKKSAPVNSKKTASTKKTAPAKKTAPRRLGQFPVEEWTREDLKHCGILAVLDAPDDKQASLALPISIENDDIKLHYFGTTGTTWSRARFEPAWIDSEDGRTILRPPLPSEKATRWMGVLPLDQDMFVATGLRLSKGKLEKTSRKRLAGYSPWRVT